MPLYARKLPQRSHCISLMFVTCASVRSFRQDTAEERLREKTWGGRGWKGADFIFLSAAPMNQQSIRTTFYMENICEEERFSVCLHAVTSS